MKIKTIHISNYRKICDAEINMEDNITVVAGANNSGKTSLVELFNSVFGKVKGRMCCDDLSAVECQKWSGIIYPRFLDSFTAGKPKEEVISSLCELISPSATPEGAIAMPPIEMKIQVDYNKQDDDIRNFADYIMEFDPSNTSFYFLYRYALSASLFRKTLDAEYEKFATRFKKLSGDKDKDQDAVRIIKEMLVLLYSNSCEETVYFSDKSYKNIVDMDMSSFKNLFNYHNIMAGRTLV